MVRVQIVRAAPGRESILTVELPEGATVRDALAKARLEAQSVGIFGERVTLQTKLSDGDRVEVYRPLKMEPKEARRRRAVRRR
ncbi:MAG: RnfH family protein [Betaproteobacteria bacterium]